MGAKRHRVTTKQMMSQRQPSAATGTEPFVCVSTHTRCTIFDAHLRTPRKQEGVTSLSNKRELYSFCEFWGNFKGKDELFSASSKINYFWLFAVFSAEIVQFSDPRAEKTEDKTVLLIVLLHKGFAFWRYVLCQIHSFLTEFDRIIKLINTRTIKTVHHNLP